MRSFLVALFAMTAVIGIPRLAYEIRGWHATGTAPARVADRAAPEVQLASMVVPPEKEPETQLVPVSLRYPAPQASREAAAQRGEKHLSGAIPEELNRLGYYNRRGKAAGRAAHAYLRETGERTAYGYPAQELLTVLPAKIKDPALNAGAGRDGEPVHLIQHQAQLPKESTSNVSAQAPGAGPAREGEAVHLAQLAQKDSTSKKMRGFRRLLGATMITCLPG